MSVSVSPELSVRRGCEAIAFYVAAFNARVIYQVGGTEDAPEVVAELAVGGSSFWVSDEAPDYKNFSPETLGGGTVRLLLRVEDPEAVQAHAVSLGATEVRPVETSHGWLLGRIADPFGHHWEIGRPLAAWPPASDQPEDGKARCAPQAARISSAGRTSRRTRQRP